MPHKMSETSNRDEIARQIKDKPPFGPGLVVDLATLLAPRLEVHGSSFSDAGGDWVRFDLFDGTKLVASRSISGY